MEKKLISLTYEEFKRETIEDKAIVMIYIKWSGISQLMKPIIQNIATKYSEKVSFYSVEVTDPSDVYVVGTKVHFFPTYLFIDKGQSQVFLSGTFSEEELDEKIKSYLEKLDKILL